MTRNKIQLNACTFVVSCEWFNFRGVQIFVVFIEVQSTNFITHELAFIYKNYERKQYGHDFWTRKCVISGQSTKIGTNEN